MARLHDRFRTNDDKKPASVDMISRGYAALCLHSFWGRLDGDIYLKSKKPGGKGALATVDSKGSIFLNVYENAGLDVWAYAMAHCLLHLAFGHFDRQNMPNNGEGLNKRVWNKACDIYIDRFLEDVKLGTPCHQALAGKYSIKLSDERKIYEHLLWLGDDGSNQEYGTNSPGEMDMIGLDHPIEYRNGERNSFMAKFAEEMALSATESVSEAGGHNWRRHRLSPIDEAAQWFLNQYPLLGGLAAAFRIVQDTELCRRMEIQVAAVDPLAGEIYVNPAAGLSEEEWKFVLAHEYLHAGLLHHKRCKGRDRYLWNVACDYTVNDWLREMHVGLMPEGALYDVELHGMSAEAIYDRIVNELRHFLKKATFRGYGKADIMAGGHAYGGGSLIDGIDLDEYFRNALMEGFDYHRGSGRGYLPAGLIEEIQALSMPPIRWDVELGKWFDELFPPIAQHRSYARASRRQGSTPDIPRPGRVVRDEERRGRTFGVVLDTSGSMTNRQIGLALGAIASYAVSKEVTAVRVVFCDADAYDAGYMSPESIAGRVEVKGRGGTKLQPGISLLENARDFPKDGPILIITDGAIEDRLHVSREHAFLLPKGCRLPFTPKGKVFHFK